MSPSLCLFAKAPEPGKAKTRLAGVLGRAGAAALARAFLLDALDTWSALPVHLQVATTGRFDEALAARLRNMNCVPQGQGDLGARLEAVLRAGLARAEVAIAVGADCPQLGETHLRQALRALDEHDAVLAPAEDGGFALLALRRCPEGLLRDIAWSAPTTLEHTTERLRARGFRVALIDSSFDVDRPEDLGRLARHLRANASGNRALRAFFDSRDNQSISLIMPVRDEERRLAAQLRALDSLSGLAQILIIDGGSSDASAAIAREAPGVEVLESAPGRAAQMNAGACKAFGGILLFVHADARLPGDAPAQIRSALAEGAEAGAFRLQTTYDPQARPRPWLRPFLPLADLRSHYTRFPYGDQAIFVRRTRFEALGGYPEQPLFEDLELSRRLHRQRPMAIAKGPVRVSARRFQERPLYHLAVMNSFPLLYRLGVSPARLAKLYRPAR